MTEHTEMVFTAIAQDETGRMETLSGIVAECEGSWIDSSMARLGGEFAGIVRISLPVSNVEKLSTALAGLKEKGISVTIRKDVPSEQSAGHRGRLKILGTDHTGIVHEISSILAQLQVNVDEFNSEVFVGSMSGDKMFSATAGIVLPEDLSFAELSEKLEEIAADIMVDIDLDEL